MARVETDRNKAVFLDRDGVINELVYHNEAGIIDSPFTVSQFRLLPAVPAAIGELHAMGFLVVLVSNQPGMAKGHLDQKTFDAIQQEMESALAREGASLDGQYYCLHHPEAKVARFKRDCSCRKPKPGLLLQAAREMSIDLAESWMVGDGLTDVQAGRAAGTKTMLVGNLKCELCRMMDEFDTHPDAIVPGLGAAAESIRRSTLDGKTGPDDAIAQREERCRLTQASQ